ncbi:uncharacterized protein LOC143020276 [Oratosquilla oratoria]|uniref:uncharacterized protein LOC143020104 n=1 Tax=Oratosquilla oratoria TaxID=337810 RepID=UPI003F77753A
MGPIGIKVSWSVTVMVTLLCVACGLIVKDLDTPSKESHEAKCQRILTNTEDDDPEKRKEDLRKLQRCLPPRVPNTDRSSKPTSHARKSFPINSIRKCLLLQEGLLTENEDVDRPKFRDTVLKDLAKYPELQQAINKSLSEKEWPYPVKPDYNTSPFLEQLKWQCIQFYSTTT